MKNFIAHFVCTAACFWLSYFMEPLQAPKPEKTEKGEYRLVMLHAKWCQPCHAARNRLESAGVIVDENPTAWRECWKVGKDGQRYRGWVKRKTDIIEIDIADRPDLINGRKDNRIPQFILQVKDGDVWEEVPGREHIGAFPPGKLRKLWPELPEHKPGKQKV